MLSAFWPTGGERACQTRHATQVEVGNVRCRLRLQSKKGDSRASVRILGDVWEEERRESCAGGVVVRRQPCCCAPAKKEDPHGLAPAGASSAQAGGVPACLARASAEIASARISAAGPALLTPRLHLSSSLSCTSNARAAPETVLMADSQSVLQSEQFAAR